MRVLLVEDDRALSLGIQHALEREGWRVDALGDGEQAASEGLLGHHDVAVLDLGLPRKSGMDVLRHWRAQGSHLPVLLLTARDHLTDRVNGLDAGADDYLVKPFDLPELLARLRALRRRACGRVWTTACCWANWNWTSPAPNCAGAASAWRSARESWR
jgi:two-component system OmpR family response regulator